MEIVRFLGIQNSEEISKDPTVSILYDDRFLSRTAAIIRRTSWKRVWIITMEKSDITSARGAIIVRGRIGRGRAFFEKRM